MFLPNYGNRVPEDGAYSGNSQIANAVNMTGNFTAPSRGADGSFAAGYFNFQGPIYNVPQIVTDIATVKTWHVDVSVSVGSLSVALSDDLDVPDAVTLIDRLTDDKLKSISASVSDSGESGSLLVNIGGFTVSHSYFGGNASWQVSGTVIAAYFDEDNNGSFSGRGLAIYDPENGTNSGLTLTVGAEVFDLYFWQNEASAPTGTITITPVAWYL